MERKKNDQRAKEWVCRGVQTPKTLLNIKVFATQTV